MSHWKELLAVVALVFGVGFAGNWAIRRARDASMAPVASAATSPACSTVRTENQKLRTALELSAHSRKHLEEALKAERAK